MKLKIFAPRKKSYNKSRQHIKKQRHYFADKGLSSQSYGFFSSHVWMWELHHKNWYFWTVVLEKTLESPLECKEIKPGNPKGNQSWVFIARTDAEAEAPILWPPDVKKWLICKDPDAGKDWRQEEKGTTENEMVGWHHQLNGHEFEQAPGVGDGQGSVLQSTGLQRVKMGDWTELNWSELKLCSTLGGIGGLISEQQRFPSPTWPLSSTLNSASERPERIVTRREQIQTSILCKKISFPPLKELQLHWLTTGL